MNAYKSVEASTMSSLRASGTETIDKVKQKERRAWYFDIRTFFELNQGWTYVCQTVEPPLFVIYTMSTIGRFCTSTSFKGESITEFEV